MSNRNISENLKYFIDNEGLNYSAPEITMQSTGLFNLVGDVTLSGNHVITTLSESATIEVGAAPNYEINSVYPKSYTVTKQFNLVANTPQDLDWTGFVAGVESFSATPTKGAAGSFIHNIGGTTTDWAPLVKGEWAWTITAVPTVTL